MVRSDEERLAKLSEGATDAFAPLAPDPKDAPGGDSTAGSGFAWSGRPLRLPTTPPAIDPDGLALKVEGSKVLGEATRSTEFGSHEASLAPAPPRTELGRQLWDIRRRVVESGVPLLDWDQIEAEVAARRGERE